MKCNKCGNTIPEESYFCPYCRKKIQKDTFLDKEKNCDIKNVFITETIITKKRQKKPIKQQCNHNEETISQKIPLTKKNKFITFFNKLFTKKHILPICLSILLAFSFVCNMFLLNNKANLTNQNSKLNAKVSSLSEYRFLYISNNLKLQFYQKHAVFVNDTDVYHKYGCEWFDESSFYTLNPELAESLGFLPCRFCIG